MKHRFVYQLHVALDDKSFGNPLVYLSFSVTNEPLPPIWSLKTLNDILPATGVLEGWIYLRDHTNPEKRHKGRISNITVQLIRGNTPYLALGSRVMSIDVT